MTNQILPMKNKYNFTSFKSRFYAIVFIRKTQFSAQCKKKINVASNFLSDYNTGISGKIKFIPITLKFKLTNACTVCK